MKKIKPCFNKCNLLIAKYVHVKQKYFCLVLIFSSILAIDLSAQGSRVWDYPVQPGTPEWEMLTYQERFEAQNIPDNLLQNMTTRDLVETCLNYPFFRDIIVSNNFQTGFNSIRSVFNGFRELEKRPDACAELLIVYKEMNPADYVKYSNKGGFSFQFTSMSPL